MVSNYDNSHNGILLDEAMMSRRLKTIANWINSNMPDYKASIQKSSFSTDRKISGTRLRWPGKGREGNRLIITKGTVIVLDHNSAETYRQNWEVERWLDIELKNQSDRKFK
jgi:hypothetical protein